MKLAILAIFIHFLHFFTWSQQGKSALSQPTVEVGETFTLTYAFPIKSNEKSILFSPEKSFLGAQTVEGKPANESIEIYAAFRDTVMDLEDGSYWIGVYELQCWDSGTFIVPPVKFVLNGKSHLLPKVVINCNLLPHQSTVELYDIKESFVDLPEEKSEWYSKLKSYWWLVMLILFTGMAVLFWRSKRRENTIEIEPHIPLTLTQLTLLAIDQLMQKELWKQNQLKAHYVELSHILKGFLSDLLLLELRERTTSETLILLKQEGLNEEILNKLKLILQQADMVKFAGSEVIEEGIQNTTNETKMVVEAMSLFKSKND